MRGLPREKTDALHQKFLGLIVFRDKVSLDRQLSMSRLKRRLGWNVSNGGGCCDRTLTFPTRQKKVPARASSRFFPDSHRYFEAGTDDTSIGRRSHGCCIVWESSRGYGIWGNAGQDEGLTSQKKSTAGPRKKKRPELRHVGTRRKRRQPEGTNQCFPFLWSPFFCIEMALPASEPPW